MTAMTMTDAFASDGSVWTARVTLRCAGKNAIDPSNTIMLWRPS